MAAKAATVVVQRGKENLPYFCTVDKNGKTFVVLVDDQDYKKIVAQGAQPTIISWNNRVLIKRLNDKPRFLTRWLLAASFLVPIVDHVNGNIHDHRQTTLRASNYDANAQNARRKHMNVSETIGVYLDRSGSYKTTMVVRRQYCTANKSLLPKNLNKAVELYDLATLKQYGAGAMTNFPDKEPKYFAMLNQDSVVKKVDEYLIKKPKTSPFRGVSHQVKNYKIPYHQKRMGRDFVADFDFDCWNAELSINMTKGGTKKRYQKGFTDKQIGAEVRAALCYDPILRVMQDVTCLSVLGGPLHLRDAEQ